jgi:chromodomain-helicase-DNA-binding protein 4
LDQIPSYPNGDLALASFKNPNTMDFDLDDYQNIGFTGRPKKRKASTQDPDYEGNMDVDEDEVMGDAFDNIDEDDDYPLHPGKRREQQKLRNLGIASRTRGNDRNRQSSTQPNYAEHYPSDDGSDEKPRSRRSLRKVTGAKASSSLFDNDVDELQNEDEGDAFLVTSDLVPERKSRKRGGKGRLRRGGPSLFASQDDDDIAFEQPVRRSDRKTKTNAVMTDITAWEDETYAPEDNKIPAAPKASGAKETFAATPDGPFKQSHCTTCGSCGADPSAPNKGLMIYCQGCSMAYHKTCLGYRSTREHLVTKIGPDRFVLQCRHCIGVRKKKDMRAPDLGVCQVCRAKGPACVAFAPKRSALQEQKLREENGGQDPIVSIRQKLIDNVDNVLFRCTTCHCAYHFEHLPPLHSHRMAGDSIRADRLAEYSAHWRCKHCLDMPHKIDTLVAWRPTNRDAYIEGQTTLDLVEDAKEYLVKYESQSYAHCEWKPGPWVYGVTNAIMRNAFPKRDDGANLLPKFDEKDAVPEEYLLADVVLDVRFKGTFKFESKKADLDKVFMIDRALIKFEGLDYVDAVWDTPPDHDSGLRWDSFLSAYNEFLNGKHFKSEPAGEIKQRLRRFRQLDFDEEVAFEDGTNGPEPRFNDFLREGNTLMKYQVQGLNWILNGFYQERSAVLADEMGLGKTIQVIALMASVSLHSPRAWPWLVVVPNSTCPNWRREIKKWAPDMRVVCYHGGKEPQRLAYEYELFPNRTREMKAHVVIMSYDSAQDDHTKQLFKGVHWIGMVVDEGQRLKNDENLLYGALQSMRIPWRLLLTGTPLQNNKRELFNLLQFIDPSKNAERLDAQYAELTKDNISELHEMIKPYFLRRTKAKVLKFLPPMAQIILPVSMSIVQEKLCKSIMERNPELIRAIFANTKLKTNERSSLNNILMQLRKCLGHPFLYSGAVEDKSVDQETMHRNLVEASSKLVLLDQMFPKLHERGHRVLIFSQFLGMLDIVEDFLTGIGLKYHRLDGNVSSLERQKRIDSFNEPGSDYFAFLLSTRAGGVGINLATADTVVILDPDFNPHQDLQALSRAHRIGQKKKVLCFQLMTKGSVEEKIMQIGRKKMALDHALVESMDANAKKGEPGEDLESILKHGAEALFTDGEKEKIKYDAAAIDKLLDRSAIKSTIAADEEDDAKGTTFSFAQVWQNKSGDLANELEVEENAEVPMGVWDAILKQREDEAKRRAELSKEVLGRGGRRRQVRRVQRTSICDQKVGLTLSRLSSTTARPSRALSPLKAAVLI